MQPLEDFFAGDLRRQRPQRRVGDLILRVEPGAGLDEACQFFAQMRHAMLACG